MKSLFIRFYVFVLLSFLLATFIGDYIRNQSNVHDFREDYIRYARFIGSSIARDYSFGRDLQESVDWWTHAMGDEVRRPIELVSVNDPRFGGKELGSDIQALSIQMSTLKDTQLIVAPLANIIEQENLHNVSELKDKVLLLEIVDEYADEYKVMYYLAYLITFICLASSVYLVARIAYRYLQDLKQGVQSISSGDYHIRIKQNNVEAFQALSDDIAEMAESLERNRRQSEIFNAAIGHELKTPLTKMRLALGMLEYERLDDDKGELLTQLNLSVEELEQLTDLVLKLSRAQLGQKTFLDIPFNAKILIDDCLELLPNKILSLEVDENLSLSGDPQLFEIVLKNLISNAQKYAGDHVRIRLSEKSSFAELTVEDDGPGLSPEQRELVFIPFYRADSSRSRSSGEGGGYGLGLAIVAEIVSLSKASIRLEQSALGGAAFILRWPLVNS